MFIYATRVFSVYNYLHFSHQNYLLRSRAERQGRYFPWNVILIMHSGVSSAGAPVGHCMLFCVGRGRLSGSAGFTGRGIASGRPPRCHSTETQLYSATVMPKLRFCLLQNRSVYQRSLLRLAVREYSGVWRNVLGLSFLPSPLCVCPAVDTDPGMGSPAF